MNDVDAQYRKLIDALVHECRDGQGSVAPKRVTTPNWLTFDEKGRAVQSMLERLSPAERQLIAEMLSEEFVAGVHTVLAQLHFAEMAPFDKGYEGTPFHDFIGRLTDWKWPENRERW